MLCFLMHNSTAFFKYTPQTYKHSVTSATAKMQLDYESPRFPRKNWFLARCSKRVAVFCFRICTP